MRKDKRRKARREIDKKSKKNWGEKVQLKDREELILLLENYFLSEYYRLVSKKW